MKVGSNNTNTKVGSLFGNRGNNQAQAPGKIGGTQGGTGMFSRGLGGGYGGLGGTLGNRYGGFRQQQRPSVPITTLGLPFNSMEKTERSTNNQRKAFQVFHINMVVMFSQYTTEELRIYDYISSDLIPHYQQSQQMQIQSYNTGSNMGGTISNQNQSQISQTTVNWYTVPYDKWEKIKDPEDFCKAKSDSDTFYSKPYSNLDPPHSLLTQVTKEKEEAEIIPNNRIKLKGFKTSKDTFSNLFNKTGKDHSTAADSSFKIEELKIKNLFSTTQTSRQNTNTNPSHTFSMIRSSTTRSARQSVNNLPAKKLNVEKQNPIQNELAFIPNIYNLSQDENIIPNLTISKEKIMLIFPFPVNLRKLDLKNNVKFINLPKTELDEYRTEINPKKDEKSESLQKEDDSQNFKGFKITIGIPNNQLKALNDNSKTHDDASEELDSISEELNGDENSDDVTKTQTLIFINDPIVQHFYIKKNQDETFSECKGPILNELLPSLKHYPIIILCKKK